MNRFVGIKIELLALAFFICGFSAGVGGPAIIPEPAKIEQNEGVFQVKLTTRIYADSASSETADYLASRLRPATGYPFDIGTGRATNAAIDGGILITTQHADASLGPEGYELTVTPRSVVIRAPEQAGLFYGAQSLLQLLPPKIFSTNAVAGCVWEVPCVHIEDQPRFKWRGLMLDVSRHFFNVSEVKRYLDEMALHKYNTFHWHLVDQDGWRIEIRKYPKLTQVGGWRRSIGFNLDPKSSSAYGPDGRYGGFYTQKEIRDVVAYAGKLHITVVPEIEMPGHSTAALSCYPELSCSGEHYEIDRGNKLRIGVYCAGNNASFEFLENILGEVFELFPAKYIHIGGDEVDKDDWKHCPKCQARIRQEGLKNEDELQSYFIRRIEKFVNAHGRTLVGWSEIMQGGLTQNATVMDWIGGGLEAAKNGHDVVMSPTGYCYFDYYQSTNGSEPLAFGYLPLERVYSFDPIPADLTPALWPHVLGAQGNLWTETIPSFPRVEYMTFPRACALAEVVWSPKTRLNWNDFNRRLQIHAERFDALGINYRKGGINPPNNNVQ